MVDPMTRDQLVQRALGWMDAARERLTSAQAAYHSTKKAADEAQHAYWLADSEVDASMAAFKCAGLGEVYKVGDEEWTPKGGA